MSLAKAKKLFAGVLLAMLVFVSANGVSPAVVSAQNGPCGRSVGGFLNFPTWYKYLQPHRTANGCELNFEFPEDLSAVALAVFEILLRVAGIVAVVFVMYGGFLYMTSTGEPDRAANGRTTLINALVGLLIAMLATAIVNLVGRNIAP